MSIKPKIKRGWVSYEVIDISKENPDVVHFKLVDRDDRDVPFDYIAGQYLTFRFDGLGPKPLVRSYTMSSSPKQTDHICISIKRVEGGVVSGWTCDQLKKGTILRARGPIGHFCFDPLNDQSLVLIAGGSGVTPFISMARQYYHALGQPGAPGTMTLIVSFKTRAERVCGAELDFLKTAHPNLKIIETYTREHLEDQDFNGRISPEMIDKIMGGRYEGYTYMTCGPVPLMEMVTQELKSKGVPQKNIKLESFV